MAHLALMNFSLTWDWALDYIREITKNQGPEMRDLADLLVPYAIKDLD